MRTIDEINSASYCGQGANQGSITPLAIHEGEGFAVLRCGGTEVRLSYTLLHHLRLAIDSGDSCWLELGKAQNALYAITCEASLGRRG